MRSLRAAVPLAIAASVIAVAPAAADAKAPSTAKASGGDAVELTYPSIVRIRVARTERALERAERRMENGQTVKAAAKLKIVRRQMSAAWRGAKYVIRTTPPPVAEDARVRAQKSAVTYATPADTAVRVLTLQHDVSASMVQLIDGAHGSGLNALSTTLNLANDRRDAALNYILSVAPSAPPEAEDARVRTRVRARAAGDPVVSTFDTVMPDVTLGLDDELQAIEGTLADATDLTAGGRRLLNAADAQVTRTRAFVNTNWPPVPAED